jgi:hypothetical protein
MQYVGACMLMRAETPIKLPTLAEEKRDNAYSRVYINEDGEGAYFWGTSLSSGYSIPLWVCQ